MKKLMMVSVLVVAVSLLCGCNAARQAVSTIGNGIGVIGAVKDDAIGAVNTLIDVSENVKTNITKGAQASVTAATK